MGHGLNFLDGDLTSLVESVRNFERVDSLVQQFLGLVKDSSSKDNNTGSSIADFIVLRGRKLGKEFGGLVMDLLKKGKC